MTNQNQQACIDNLISIIEKIKSGEISLTSYRQDMDFYYKENKKTLEREYFPSKVTTITMTIKTNNESDDELRDENGFLVGVYLTQSEGFCKR
jgi:hypothetical protein